MDKIAKQDEALLRARQGVTASNYPAIFAGFMSMGIAEDDIRPRENVFTYAAWRALGRHVRKGEHGIHVTIWLPVIKEDPETHKKQVIGNRPWTATVFHVSQTDPDEGHKP